MVDIRTFKYLLANKIAGHKLPVIRATTAQLVALLTNPHSDLKSIANSVLRDQSLTARVLSVANSVYYRRQDEHITSISRAGFQSEMGYSKFTILVPGLSSFVSLGANRFRV